MDLVIINADDWGLNDAHTDAIAACIRAGRVTSTSGMVFMAGSERAAELARDERWPVGMHLNFIDEFDSDTVPRDVRYRQSRLVNHFVKGGLRRWTFSLSMYRMIGAAIADQLKEFERLYGAPPTHIDGHQHLHQNLTVLSSTALPTGVKMRPSFTFLPSEKPWPNRVLRAALNGMMRRRFPGPARFVSIRSLVPTLGASRASRTLAMLDGGTVEVMTHPGWEDEFHFLLSAQWSDIFERRPLGSYRDL